MVLWKINWPWIPNFIEIVWIRRFMFTPKRAVWQLFHALIKISSNFILIRFISMGCWFALCCCLRIFSKINSMSRFTLFVFCSLLLNHYFGSLSFFLEHGYYNLTAVSTENKLTAMLRWFDQKPREIRALRMPVSKFLHFHECISCRRFSCTYKLIRETLTMPYPVSGLEWKRMNETDL